MFSEIQDLINSFNFSHLDTDVKKYLLEDFPISGDVKSLKEVIRDLSFKMYASNIHNYSLKENLSTHSALVKLISLEIFYDLEKLLESRSTSLPEKLQLALFSHIVPFPETKPSIIYAISSIINMIEDRKHSKYLILSRVDDLARMNNGRLKNYLIIEKFEKHIQEMYEPE